MKHQGYIKLFNSTYFKQFTNATHTDTSPIHQPTDSSLTDDDCIGKLELLGGGREGNPPNPNPPTPTLTSPSVSPIPAIPTLTWPSHTRLPTSSLSHFPPLGSDKTAVHPSLWLTPAWLPLQPSIKPAAPAKPTAPARPSIKLVAKPAAEPAAKQAAKPALKPTAKAAHQAVFANQKRRSRAPAPPPAYVLWRAKALAATVKPDATPNARSAEKSAVKSAAQPSTKPVAKPNAQPAAPSRSIPTQPPPPSPSTLISSSHLPSPLSTSSPNSSPFSRSVSSLSPMPSLFPSWDSPPASTYVGTFILSFFIFCVTGFLIINCQFILGRKD